MRALKIFASALGITVLLLAGLDYAASAATGRPTILGKVNKAAKVTTVQRTTSGPALRVVTRSAASAPFAVNGRGKIANLNADTVDGLDGASLQNRVIRYSLPDSSNSAVYSWDLPGLPVGTYLATYSVFSSGAAAVECRFVPSPGAPPIAVSSATNFGAAVAVNGSGILRHTGTTQLRCQGSGAFFVDTRPNGPTEVTFTRIDDVRQATAFAPES